MDNTEIKNAGIYLCKYKGADRWERIEILHSDDLLIAKFNNAIMDVSKMALFEFIPVTIMEEK